jgi:hypothetical protein
VPNEPQVDLNTAEGVRYNAWKMLRYKGARATVPGGHQIAIEEDYIDVQPPGADLDGVIDQIQKWLKHPAPGCAYVWRSRQADDTIRMVALHWIRPVKYSELKEGTPSVSMFGIEQSVPDQDGHFHTETLIGWKKACLYEVRPDKTKEWFVDPGRYHLKLVTDMPDRVAQEFEEARIGTAKLEAKDPASQAQEIERDVRRRH